MISYYYRSLRNKGIQRLEKPKKGTWIFAYDITPQEFSELVELGFDAALLEDANDYFEVPRFEYTHEANYLFTRVAVDTTKGEPSTAPVLIAISDNYVLTLAHKKFEVFNDFTETLEESFISTQKVKFVIAMISNIASYYERSIIKLRRTMTKHFDKDDVIDEGDITELVSLESTLTDYESSLIPTQIALEEMLGGEHTLDLGDDDIKLVEHLVRDFTQLEQSTRMVLNSIQNIRSAHSSILANELNRTMKTLTATTIILTIPTIIASIFGMNVWLPFPKEPYSFPSILLITAALSFAVYLLFKKMKWL